MGPRPLLVELLGVVQRPGCNSRDIIAAVDGKMTGTLQLTAFCRTRGVTAVPNEKRGTGQRGDRRGGRAEVCVAAQPPYPRIGNWSRGGAECLSCARRTLWGRNAPTRRVVEKCARLAGSSLVRATCGLGPISCRAEAAETRLQRKPITMPQTWQSHQYGIACSSATG